MGYKISSHFAVEEKYRISFEGNAYITGEKAYQYTLYRAAEIAKQNKCDWFEIMDKDEMSRREFAGFLGYVEKPRNAIVIKLIKEGPTAKTYSADELLKSIEIHEVSQPQFSPGSPIDSRAR